MKNNGLHQHRFKNNPLEYEFAKEWDKINSTVYNGTHTLDYLLAKDPIRPDGEVTKRDREVAATVIQWLGSPVGMGFVEKVLTKK